MVLAACGAPPASDAPAADLGWATAVVLDPALFAKITQADREAWTALHSHDLTKARRPAGARGVVHERASWEEKTFQEDLARLSQLGVAKLQAAWAGRGVAPAGLDLVVARASACREPPADADPASLASWATHGRRYADLPPEQVAALANEPLIQVEDGGVTRQWYDPCVAVALAEGAAKDLPAGVETLRGSWVQADLEAALFAPWLDGSDLAATGGPDPGGGLSARIEATLGLPDAAPDHDDVERAREEVREADRRLLDVRKSLLARANPDGVALIEQVGVLERLRQEVLVARARRDLVSGYPRRALAILSLARDVTERSVGPRNGPALFALLAEANLRTGHTREALDTLQVLAASRPETGAIREILGDLAVLEGLDRQGDSKEH